MPCSRRSKPWAGCSSFRPDPDTDLVRQAVLAGGIRALEVQARDLGFLAGLPLEFLPPRLAPLAGHPMLQYLWLVGGRKPAAEDISRMLESPALRFLASSRSAWMREDSGWVHVPDIYTMAEEEAALHQLLVRIGICSRCGEELLSLDRSIRPWVPTAIATVWSNSEAICDLAINCSQEASMKMMLKSAVCGMVLAAAGSAAFAQDASMSFFVTSQGPGDGANLGGLDGADAHCQQLAEAAGAGGMTWRAYLSTSTTDARDRIGSGPWHNAEGKLIAEDVAALHSEANNIGKQTALSEQGNEIEGRGDSPNRHDILTGSDPDGRAVADMTCNDWTSNDEGQAMVGHHDRMGLRDDAPSRSWNSSHPSQGCSQEALRSTGGDGLFYCFGVTD